MTLSAGTRLGPYEILGPLGAGGMGEVYRARDTRLGRDVAVKILPERLASDPRALARFDREARAVAALSHPNVLALHDLGNENGVAFVVMELLEGESVDLLIAREAIPWRRAVEIGAAVADGLAAAHARGIIHRDLKPSNIFVTDEGHAKILDFGLARQTLPASESDQTAGPTETVPGSVMGTVGYMSPEQVEGRSADARSDIFSFGCVLYEMLAGRRAFDGRTGASTLAAILRDHPPDLSEAGRRIPPALFGLVRRCLEKNPEARFQSSRDLAFALKETLSGSGTAAMAPTEKSRSTRRAVLATVLAASIAAAALLLFQVGRSRTRLVPRRASALQSLAVLPFSNLSGDPEQEFFADGMTEQLITSLARLPELRVISRTSSMSYKKTEKRLPEIARELDVEGVVEGSIVRVGPRVRVTAKLIQAATEKNLWADSFERDASDILALQGEIAATIARKVEVELTPDERSRLDAKRRIDPQAYEAYVRGRYFWNKVGEANLKKAVEEFRKALDVDPTYAAAYAGLADAYAVLGYQTFVSPVDVAPKAKAAAAKALELDPGLGSAHASLGYVHMYFDWDFAASESEFRRAIALDPNSVTAHQWYGLLLTAMLRPSEARREVAKARALDPLSGTVAWIAGGELFYDRRYDEAIKALNDAIAMDEKNGPAHFWLGRVFQAQGKFEQAIAQYRLGEPFVSQFPPSFAAVGHLYAISGKRKEALAVLADLDRMAREKYISPFCWALVYLGLGENDKAFDFLDRSVKERTTWLVWLRRDPRFDPVRTDPRFQEILRRVGFPASG